VHERMLPLVTEQARKLGFIFHATAPGAPEALKLARRRSTSATNCAWDLRRGRRRNLSKPPLAVPPLI
jgi:hypothetical protein